MTAYAAICDEGNLHKIAYRLNSYHEIPANRFQDALQFIGSTADTPSKPSNHITVNLPKGRNEWHITIDDFNGYQVMEATNAPYGSVLIGKSLYAILCKLPSSQMAA